MVYSFEIVEVIPLNLYHESLMVTWHLEHYVVSNHSQETTVH